jgi:hypothetical protein
MKLITHIYIICVECYTHALVPLQVWVLVLSSETTRHVMKVESALRSLEPEVHSGHFMLHAHRFEEVRSGETQSSLRAPFLRNMPSCQWTVIVGCFEGTLCFYLQGSVNSKMKGLSSMLFRNVGKRLASDAMSCRRRTESSIAPP